MTHRSRWRLGRAAGVFAMVVALAASACDRTSVPVTWTANGVQLTPLDMVATSPKWEEK